LPIFTAEIAGNATVVFAALGEVQALNFINDSFIRSELCGLRTTEGAPLWDGEADMAIRSASANERAVWERGLADDLASGVHEGREEAIQSNGFCFLVEYREPDE